MAELKGFSFPLRFSNLGSFSLSTGVDKIKENIRAIVLTSMGDRIMNPDIGTLGRLSVFQSMSASQLNLLKHHLKTGIEAGETRISVLDIQVTQTTQDGELLVDLTFKLDTETEYENLVFTV